MSKDSLPNIGTVTTAKIDGLSIRYAKAGSSKGTPVILSAPWPESFYSFHRLAPKLATKHPVLLIDLPGFGLSESRPDVMAPEAMGNFIIQLFDHFGISLAHVVAPDVGTPAFLFTASKRPDLFESFVLGGAAMGADMATGPLNDLIHSPKGSLTAVGAEAFKDYFDYAETTTPSIIVKDFWSGSAGPRLDEATQFVRAYSQDSPKLEPLLSKINTPTLIIAGKNDFIVPPNNGQFLADRLPNNRYELLDAGHRIWDEAPDQYIEAIISWLDGGYRSL